MLVVRPAGDDAPVAGQDLQRGDRIVDEPLAERRRLDADSSHRTAQRDRLQLRDHGWHDPVREGGIGKRDVGDYSLRLDDARLGVDPDHLIEMREIDPRRLLRRPVAKQVRRRLVEAEAGAAARHRGQLLLQAGSLVGVGGHPGGRYRKARLIG